MNSVDYNTHITTSIHPIFSALVEGLTIQFLDMKKLNPQHCY